MFSNWGLLIGSDPAHFIWVAFTLAVAAFCELPQACVMFSISSASDLIKSV